jgi:hypothetical protein
VGGLFDFTETPTIFSNIKSSLDITARYNVGGLIGKATDQYRYLWNNEKLVFGFDRINLEGDLTSTAACSGVGGILGSIGSGSGSSTTEAPYLAFSNVTIAGKISGPCSKAGGLIGGGSSTASKLSPKVSASNIEMKADVTGSTYVGGLVGQWLPSNTNASASPFSILGYVMSGSLRASSQMGGGAFGQLSLTNLSMKNTLIEGKVDSQNQVGGFVGSYLNPNTTPRLTFNVDHSIVNTLGPQTATSVGGFIGSFYSGGSLSDAGFTTTLTQAFYNADRFGPNTLVFGNGTSSPDNIGKAAAYFQDANNFPPGSWVGWETWPKLKYIITAPSN